PQKSSSSEGRRLSQKTAQCTSHHAKADSTDVQTLDIPQQPDSSHTAKPWAQKVAGELPGEKNAQTDPDAQYTQPSLTTVADQSSKIEEPKQIVEEPGGDPDPLTQKLISATCPLSPEDQLQRKSTCVQTEEISNSGTRSVPEKEQKSDKNTPAAARHKTQATDKDKKTSFAIQTEEIQPAVLGKEPVPTQEIGHMDLKQAKNTDKGVKGAVKPNQTELVKKDCGPAPTPASSSVNKPPVDTRTALEDSSLHVI
ncbi:hypothetical protein AB205_0214110, partial [Aquarana catesbeiana]